MVCECYRFLLFCLYGGAGCMLCSDNFIFQTVLAEFNPLHSLANTTHHTTQFHNRAVDTGQARPQHQQRLHIQPLRKPFITLYNQHFIEVYHFIF